jgi:hypothetical protein
MATHQPGGIVVKLGASNNLTLWTKTAENTYTVVPGGISVAVVAASTANVATITLAATPTLDGVNLAAGDLVLLRAQASPANRGVYQVTASGNWIFIGRGSKIVEVLGGTVSGRGRYLLAATYTYSGGLAFYG